MVKKQYMWAICRIEIFGANPWVNGLGGSGCKIECENKI